jgi:hypothetical protein
MRPAVDVRFDGPPGKRNHEQALPVRPFLAVLKFAVILRIWRGWTSTPAAAEAYEALLNGTIAPAIMSRGIDGLHDLSVFRRIDSDGDTEFLTLMTFNDWSAVEEFAGPDPTASVVPQAAREILSRHDEHSQHYELMGRHTA